MRVILIIEDDTSGLEIGKPKATVLELREKNAVLIDLPIKAKQKFSLKLKNLEDLTLNSRQNDFLNSLSRKTITNEHYRLFFKNKISRETARGDLQSLVKQGLFLKKGRLKSTIYQIKESFLKQ